MTGTLLAADLHNHTWLSDGEGDPGTAFAQLRDAGLDVAALTDHASVPRHVRDEWRSSDVDPLPMWMRTAPASLDVTEWALLEGIADRADDPGAFTALRGFEWTEPRIGHVNVWFSAGMRHVTTPGNVSGLHDWLATDDEAALFGYNHPGRERGRFNDFRFDPRLVQRMVSLEMFNRYDDYVAVGVRAGSPSPLLACLRAGWRPGLIGVSDEHGSDYGLRGKGRAGLWANEHSRSGVRDALARRHVFATREPGLRLQAELADVPMGSPSDPAGALRVELQVPPAWEGYDVVAQVLVDDGGLLPSVLTERPLDPEGVTEIEAPGLEGYPWGVLRVAAPAVRDASVDLPVDEPLTQRALAYASPWWFGSAGPGSAAPAST